MKYLILVLALTACGKKDANQDADLTAPQTLQDVRLQTASGTDFTCLAPSIFVRFRKIYCWTSNPAGNAHLGLTGTAPQVVLTAPDPTDLFDIFEIYQNGICADPFTGANLQCLGDISQNVVGNSSVWETCQTSGDGVYHCPQGDFDVN